MSRAPSILKYSAGMRWAARSITSSVILGLEVGGGLPEDGRARAREELAVLLPAVPGQALHAWVMVAVVLEDRARAHGRCRGRAPRSARTPGRGRRGAAATGAGPGNFTQRHWSRCRSQSPIRRSRSRAFRNARASARSNRGWLRSLVEVRVLQDLGGALKAGVLVGLRPRELVHLAHHARRTPCGTRRARDRRASPSGAAPCEGSRRPP